MIYSDFSKIPRNSFSVIAADPPWKFASNSKAKPGRNPLRHYDCMSDVELGMMPVDQIAKASSLLLCWTTAPMLERSLRVVRGWGFHYKSQLVWPKQRVGTGFWVRNRHEIVLLCTRGKFPCPKPAPFKDSILEGEQGRHSAKPETLQDQVDAIWPDEAKIELFARRTRPGWDVFGNEADG